MRLTNRSFDLPLGHPFTISRGTTTVQRSVLVELEEGGTHGYGEVTEVAFYGATIERILAALERVRPIVEAAPADPAVLVPRLASELVDEPFALCGLDAAVHDLWGKRMGQPVWKLWGLSLDRCPPTDYTIGIDEIDVMIHKMEEFPGFPVYKIKLGTPHDLEIVRALRRHTEAVFRVDANGAWSADETLRNAEALASLGVEYIEQPMPPERDGEMERLARESALPLVADESCLAESDVERCAGRFHGINIKLIKCGGLSAARRMIDRARQLGLRVMVGCFTESSVGISTIAQLLPLVDYADLDGALLVARDIADGIRIDRGRVLFPDVAGCGVTLRNTPLA